MEKYPDYDNSKTVSYAALNKDYVSGKTSVQLTGGAIALRHMKEAMELNTPMSMIPTTAAHTAYESKINTLADELTAFYGHSTDISVEAMKSTLLSRTQYNRTAALKTQARSMGDRLDEFEHKWEQGKPSAYYEQPMPHISDEAKAARKFLDPSYTYEPEGKSTPKVPPTPGSSRPAPPVGFEPVQPTQPK
jgi:hypothetical protein